jgi:hypothetical protein
MFASHPTTYQTSKLMVASRRAGFCHSYCLRERGNLGHEQLRATAGPRYPGLRIPGISRSSSRREAQRPRASSCPAHHRFYRSTTAVRSWRRPSGQAQRSNIVASAPALMPRRDRWTGAAALPSLCQFSLELRAVKQLPLPSQAYTVQALCELRFGPMATSRFQSQALSLAP